MLFGSVSLKCGERFVVLHARNLSVPLRTRSLLCEEVGACLVRRYLRDRLVLLGDSAHSYLNAGSENVAALRCSRVFFSIALTFSCSLSGFVGTQWSACFALSTKELFHFPTCTKTKQLRIGFGSDL